LSEVLVNPYRYAVTTPVVWQSQDYLATGLWTGKFTQTATEDWMYAVKNDTGSTKSLATLQIYGKNVGTPDLLYQGIILENDEETVKATSTNNLGISDFSVGGKYATFNFTPTDVNTDEYIGFRAANAGTNFNTNYMAISRDTSPSSPNLYAVYPNTVLSGASFYGLTWIASG